METFSNLQSGIQTCVALLPNSDWLSILDLIDDRTNEFLEVALLLFGHNIFCSVGMHQRYSISFFF